MLKTVKVQAKNQWGGGRDPFQQHRLMEFKEKMPALPVQKKHVPSFTNAFPKDLNLKRERGGGGGKTFKPDKVKFEAFILKV